MLLDIKLVPNLENAQVGGQQLGLIRFKWFL